MLSAAKIVVGLVQSRERYENRLDIVNALIQKSDGFFVLCLERLSTAINSIQIASAADASANNTKKISMFAL